MVKLPSPRTSSPIPPLESGDRLTQTEFERRYNAIPYIKKAELIEGVVYVTAPLRFEPHAEPHGLASHEHTAFLASLHGESKQ